MSKKQRSWSGLPFDAALDGYPILSPEGLAAIATDSDYQQQIISMRNSFAAMREALRGMREQFNNHTCKHHGPMICDKCEALNAADMALAPAEGEKDEEEYDADAERVKFQQQLGEAMVKAGAREVILK